MLVLPPPSLVPDRVSSSVISNGGGSRPRSREDALVGRSGLTECDIRYGILGSVLLFGTYQYALYCLAFSLDVPWELV